MAELTIRELRYLPAIVIRGSGLFFVKLFPYLNRLPPSLAPDFNGHMWSHLPVNRHMKYEIEASDKLVTRCVMNG